MMDTMSVRQRAKIKLERELGKEIIAALTDPKTIEIMCNADGWVWRERLGQPMERLCQIPGTQAQAIIETVAGFHGKVITRSNPILEGELPLDGSRFAGQIPPIVASPVFAIRKKALSIFTLTDYVTDSIMTERQREILHSAIVNHKNILVVGGTGSGKTTLINALIEDMVQENPLERLAIIEDTGEIQCSSTNHIQYHTTYEISMDDILRLILRMRPDRILVGEVRGPESLTLLMSWNTGHEGGAATLHANSAIAGLTRLATLVSMNKSAPRQIEPIIAEAVHIVVYISKTTEGRKVKEIIEVKGFECGKYITKQI